MIKINKVFSAVLIIIIGFLCTSCDLPSFLSGTASVPLTTVQLEIYNLMANRLANTVIFESSSGWYLFYGYSSVLGKDVGFLIPTRQVSLELLKTMNIRSLTSLDTIAQRVALEEIWIPVSYNRIPDTLKLFFASLTKEVPFNTFLQQLAEQTLIKASAGGMNMFTPAIFIIPTTTDNFLDIEVFPYEHVIE